MEGWSVERGKTTYLQVFKSTTREAEELQDTVFMDFGRFKLVEN